MAPDCLKQLKELDVYDDATIIVTANHGGTGKHDLQVIYYMKQPGESHEKSPVTNAPISHCDFLPTVAQMTGLDYTKYGNAVTDFAQDELRERTLWLRKHDDSYPDAYDAGGVISEENVYYKYSYTGDILALITQIDAGPTAVVAMAQSFF